MDLSWLCSLSQEEQITIKEHDITERILEHRSEAEATLHTTETKTDTLEGSEKQLHIHHIATPPSQCSIMLRGLPWASVSSRRKKEPGGGGWSTSIPQLCGLLCGSLYSDLAPQGLHGNLQCLNTRNLTGTDKGEGAFNSQCMDLGRLSSYL